MDYRTLHPEKSKSPSWQSSFKHRLWGLVFKLGISKFFSKASPRFAVSIEVELEHDGNSAWITNISESGCFLSFLPSSNLPYLGSEVGIKMQSRAYICKVVHHRDYGCGVKFLAPTKIAAPEIEQLRSASYFPRPMQRTAP
jgi:hypothetical protein